MGPATPTEAVNGASLLTVLVNLAPPFNVRIYAAVNTAAVLLFFTGSWAWRRSVCSTGWQRGDFLLRRKSAGYSRFTFAEYTEIVSAFSLKKDALRGTWKGEGGQPRDERVRAALEQVERYKAKVERLEIQNQLLLEQFVTWAHNAERKGVTVMMLNAPLPKPQRDRTKGVK